MQQIKRFLLLKCLILVSIIGYSQFDSLLLACPLENGAPRIIRASDRDYQRSSEYGVMLTSKTDTLVKAVYSGSIISVSQADDMKYDMVIQYRGFYFWYAGVLYPLVKQGSKINKGDVIGMYKPGDLLEILMFDKEEPVNPRKLMKCN